MIIELIGPLGSGKGTQARFLVEKYKFFYFESGKILRDLAKKDPEINSYINQKGKLFPIEKAEKIFENYLEKHKPDLKNILLDGSPRELRQYKMFSKWLSDKGTKIEKVILLEISEEESIKRTSSRRYCEKCGEIYNLVTDKTKLVGICDKCGGKLLQRPDDTPEVIKNRLSVYKERTLPLIEYLEKENKIIKINGEAAPEVIFKEIEEKLNL